MTDFQGLSEDELAVIWRAKAELDKNPLIPCTTCDYCAKVCPEGIGISGTFTAANLHTLYKNLEVASQQLGWLVGAHGKKPAIECVQCGKCEEACPQHIKIIEELESAAALDAFLTARIPREERYFKAYAIRTQCFILDKTTLDTASA